MTQIPCSPHESPHTPASADSGDRSSVNEGANTEDEARPVKKYRVLYFPSLDLRGDEREGDGEGKKKKDWGTREVQTT